MEITLVKKLERAFFVLFIIALGFLSFLGGSLTVYFKAFPYNIVHGWIQDGKGTKKKTNRGDKNAKKPDTNSKRDASKGGQKRKVKKMRKKR